MRDKDVDIIQNVRIRKRKGRKIKKIFFATGITAVVFVVATYAWFIGTMQAVVNTFEIDIQSSDGLTLSLDGELFSSQVVVGEDEVTTSLEDSYTGHKNSWVGSDGLIPISSIGKLDETNSVLKLFSKTSISSSKGGFMLRADPIDNSVAEVPGYITFDLFIKNKSGSGYSEDFNLANDEGVYLTQESIVKMIDKQGGTDVVKDSPGDGVQNTMRVAFMQIGRVNLTTAKEGVQAITCTGGDSQTPLCNKGPATESDGRGYTWNIWEPNDTAHTTTAISQFSRICKKRTADDEYNDACEPIVDGTASKTFSINSAITSDDKVNVYDGLNDYTPVSDKLTDLACFTDSLNNLESADRPELFYLAPNSITKVRVYVYIEGQDVDNFDSDTDSKQISVTFGFSKDKFGIEE